MRRVLFALAALCLAQPVAAQPKSDVDKGSAKALLQSGLKLYAAKDYLGALAVFKDAYARFPSSKILLNIATTLTKLDRFAEAANAYQQYLDAEDADPAKRAEVERVLGELDRKVGVVELQVTPADAEIKLGDAPWQPAARVQRLRVAPGAFVVRARRDLYKATERGLTLTAGQRETVALALEAQPDELPVSSPGPMPVTDDTGIDATFTPPARARLGALVRAHFDPMNTGGAALVGVAVDVTRRLQVQGAAILGPYFGGYAGVTFAMRLGTLRPYAAAGLPVFGSDGARVAVRGAGGVEVVLSRHVSLHAELGVERLLNPQASVDSPTLFVPAVGAIGRL